VMKVVTEQTCYFSFVERRVAGLLCSTSGEVETFSSRCVFFV
jgi:hypothetical protein